VDISQRYQSFLELVGLKDDKWCHEEGDAPKTVPVIVFPSYD